MSPSGREAPALFREAMASFPSGVTIVTTVDDLGVEHGFTATSFCSLSADPPLVLVCLAKIAQCHSVFETHDRWAIHVIHADHKGLAVRFATRGADKFGGDEFTVDDRGVPVLNDAPMRLDCSAHARYDGGDHTILVAYVNDVVIRDHVPVLYFRRAFHRIDGGHEKPGLTPAEIGER